MPKPLLVVLGLNGALVQRCRPMQAAGMSLPDVAIEQHTIGVQKVFVRPGVKAGLDALAKAGHTVGIWSSTTMRNTDPIINSIFSDYKFAFVWSRDHTSPDLFRRQASLGDSDSDFATLKDVALLWRYRVASPDGAFGPKNTVVVDDEPCKSRRFADNLLWIPAFNVEDVAAAAVDESLGFNKAMSFIMGELSETDDVRKLLPERVMVTAPTPEPKR